MTQAAIHPAPSALAHFCGNADPMETGQPGKMPIARPYRHAESARK